MQTNPRMRKPEYRQKRLYELEGPPATDGDDEWDEQYLATEDETYGLTNTLWEEGGRAWYYDGASVPHKYPSSLED
jgi:hypothetical protein